MKMRFDSTASEIDEKRGHQHLGHSDDVPRRDRSGPDPGHPDREKADCAADQDRRPDMDMNLARDAIPGPRGHQQGDHDASHPLEKHQPREKLIGLAKDLSLVVLEEFFRAVARGFRNCAKAV